jgi:hypothetical protein
MVLSTQAALVMVVYQLLALVRKTAQLLFRMYQQHKKALAEQ